MWNIGHLLAQEQKRSGRQIELASLLVRHVGCLSDDVIAHYCNNKGLIPKALEQGFVIDRAVGVIPSAGASAKFALLKDFGIITVPDDYDHATQLDKFMKKNREKFHSVNNNITDVNFPNPTRVLKPGDKLSVRAFKQVVGGTTTSEERMAFLVTQNAIHTGAQGASLVFEVMRDQLPNGKWYASFDEREHLWMDAGRYRVPLVSAYWGDVFQWNLGCFADVWNMNSAFLCFTETEP